LRHAVLDLPIVFALVADFCGRSGKSAVESVHEQISWCFAPASGRKRKFGSFPLNFSGLASKIWRKHDQSAIIALFPEFFSLELFLS
jgi:hypothetical protein